MTNHKSIVTSVLLTFTSMKVIGKPEMTGIGCGTLAMRIMGSFLYFRAIVALNRNKGLMYDDNLVEINSKYFKVLNLISFTLSLISVLLLLMHFNRLEGVLRVNQIRIMQVRGVEDASYKPENAALDLEKSSVNF